MTNEQIAAALDMIVLIILLSLLGIGAIVAFLGWLDARIPDRRTEAMPVGDANILSSSASSMALESRPSVQTGPDETASDGSDGAAAAAELDRKKAERRALLLGVYREMRGVPGMTRKQASAILHAAGLPLDNNLWSEAAPLVTTPEAPAAPAPHITPIVGRPSQARYQDAPPVAPPPGRQLSPDDDSEEAALVYAPLS